MYVKKNFKLWLAVLALALPLLFVGTASAKYMSDGAVPDPTGTTGFIVPTDGICVLSIDMAGNLVTDATITNKRDCDARLVAVTAVTSNDTLSNVCGITGKNTAGVKYAAPSKNVCVTVDGSGYINGSISLVNLDRVAAMCVAKGGVMGDNAIVKTTANGTAAQCFAYGWQYRGQDTTGTPLSLSSGPGFCYTAMRTGIAEPSCPTVVGTVVSVTTGTPTTTTSVSVGTQTATSSTAFGYSVADNGTCSVSGKTTSKDCIAAFGVWTQNFQCIYAYGINGPVNAKLTKADNTTVAVNATVNLSAFTTMGTCLANGGSWANWMPKTGTDTTIGTVTTAATFDLVNQAVNADEGCLHCHSYKAQQNGPAERWKDSYLKTGHKNMLRKVVAGQLLVDATGTPYATDGTNAINMLAGTINVSGVDHNLRYIWGDWMIANPSVAYDGGSTYGCGACHTAGFKDNTNPGVQSIGTSGYTPAEPAKSGAAYVAAVTAGHKWDLEGIQCSRCHNATVPSVTAAQIAASTFPTTAPTSGGMGALASGTGRTNLCFGCHQSIAKDWPAGTTTTDPTKIPTGVSHGAAPGRDFNGHVLGNSFLNSVHSNYTGTIKLNSLGKYDLGDPNGTSQYNSIFKGYTCWQTATGNSPAKTKADGTEIKTKTDCDSLYACSKVGYATSAACTTAGGTWATTWRADASGDLGTTQGSCTTCHDVHNSLFVASQEEAAIRKTCKDCHVNNAATGASDAAAPQVVISQINHPMSAGTPFDASLYGDDSCAVCHMATQAVENTDQNSMPAHVWRINTNASYNTFPTVTQFYGGVCSKHTGTVVAAATKFVQAIYPSDVSSAACTTTSVGGTWTSATKDQNAQTSPDTNSNAVWVDLDMACGQCHGGSGGPTATHNNAPYFTKAGLAAGAAQMHNAGYVPPTGTTPVVSHGTVTQTGYLVSFTDSSTDSGDTSNLDAVTVNWGDGATSAGVRGGIFTHTYTGRARNVSIVHMVRNSTDQTLYAKEYLKLAVPIRYNVTGTVKTSTGTAITGASVYLKLNNHARQIVKSDGTGAFTFSNVMPGSYTIYVYKSGVTFGAAVPVTVTSADAAANVTAINP